MSKVLLDDGAKDGLVMLDKKSLMLLFDPKKVTDKLFRLFFFRLKVFWNRVLMLWVGWWISFLRLFSALSSNPQP